MKETNSHKIPFTKLKETIVNTDGVVLIDGEFWNIHKVQKDHTFSVKKGKKSNYVWKKDLMLIHTHPSGKGFVNGYDGIKPLFIYDTKIFRKDIPKNIMDGDKYDSIDVETYKGLYKANLTGHIVQDSKNSKDGGFVHFDANERVIVKLKDGSFKTYYKENLFFKKTSYSPKKYKINWFYNDSDKMLPAIINKGLSLKGNPYKEYLELMDMIDPHIEMSSDFDFWKKQNALKTKMNSLWVKLSPSQKKKIEKLNKNNK